MTNYYPINEELARKAKEMISFYDYVEGSQTKEYRLMVDNVHHIGENQKKKVDEIHHEKIDKTVDAYAKRLADNFNKRNEITARMPSIMIAGSGNFDNLRKEKQSLALDANFEEFQQIQELIEKIRGIGTAGISSDDDQAIEKLKAKLEKLQGKQEIMKKANAYFRKHKTMDGCPGLSEKTITEITKNMADWSKRYKTIGKPFEAFQLSNNNANIRQVKKRIEALEKKKGATFAEWEFCGGAVIANKKENRFQVVFDEKPDAETRDKLRKNGFRWAPSAGVWQRQLNGNAYYAADRISEIRPKCGTLPTNLQRSTPQK